MNNTSKYALSRNTTLVQFGYRLARGVRAYGRSVYKLVAMLGSWLAVYIFWLLLYWQLDFDNPLLPTMELSLNILLILFLAAVPVTLFWLWGRPIKAGTVQRNLIRAGLTNSAGEGPTLIDIVPDSHNPKIKIYKFWVVGIPLPDWQEKVEAIQSALNATVAKIQAGKDGRYILVYAAPSVTSLPHTIYWTGDSFGKTVLALGESVLGTVTVDLAHTPHVSVGGSTGSGKTYLVLSLIYQALIKEMEVFILDLKGGVTSP